jgi:hypothetical protein
MGQPVAVTGGSTAMTKEETMNRKRGTWLVLCVLIVGTVSLVTGAAPTHTRSFNCKIVSCPAPACEDYEHLEVPPGQCCPVCVPN